FHFDSYFLLDCFILYQSHAGRCSSLPAFFYIFECPKCLDLFVAASIHFIKAWPTPSSSNTWRPASVVPPGLVTFSLNLAGSFPDDLSISAAPDNVWIINALATDLSKPFSIAACSIASTI